MSKSESKSKKCLNPICKLPFVPGHYGDRQVVGKGPKHIYTVHCRSCKGSGQKHGQKCWKCAGVGDVKQSCTEWYKTYWARVHKPPRGIPAEIFSKIEKAARPFQLKHACLIAARESALRKGELLGLTWRDILDEDGKIKTTFELQGQWDDVEGFKAMKVGAGRNGYFMPKAIPVLSKLEHGKPDDRVFPFYENEIWSWFVELQKELGIKNPETRAEYRWHDLRHSLISELVRGKGDKGLLVAAEIAGHSNLNTTRGYSQMAPNEVLDEAIKLRSGK